MSLIAAAAARRRPGKRPDPPAPGVPAAPTDVVATAVSHNRVDLTWTHGAGGGERTGYEIERRLLEDEEFDLHIFPGDNLVALVNGAAADSKIRIHANEDGSAYTYDIGTAELAPANGVLLRGDPVTLGPLLDPGVRTVTAPTRIVGTGNRVFDLSSSDGVVLERLDLSGGTGTFPNGRVLHQGTNITMRFCKVHGSNTQGWGNGGAIVEDSEFTNNSLTLQSGVSGAFKSTQDGVRFRRCYVHDNNGHGIWGDCQAADWEVTDCLVEDNGRTGIFYEISPGPALFFNCVVRGNNASNTSGYGGIIVASSKNVTVDGCVFEGNNIQNMKIYHERRAGYTTGIDCGSCAVGHCIENILVQNCHRIGTPNYTLDTSSVGGESPDQCDQTGPRCTSSAGEITTLNNTSE